MYGQVGVVYGSADTLSSLAIFLEIASCHGHSHPAIFAMSLPTHVYVEVTGVKHQYDAQFSPSQLPLPAQGAIHLLSLLSSPKNLQG